jgi:hypothetical protein
MIGFMVNDLFDLSGVFPQRRGVAHAERATVRPGKEVCGYLMELPFLVT